MYSTGKPGRCPRVDSYDVGPCGEWCLNDDDCKDDLKCCSSGCGHTCQMPGRTEPYRRAGMMVWFPFSSIPMTSVPFASHSIPIARESTTPREREIWGFCRQHLATLATPTIRSIKCKQSPVYGVFDRYFHIPLSIVTKHELGLPFHLGSFPNNLVQIRPQSFSLSWSQTDRQTDT